jgi:hypothetical protein
MGQKIFKKNRTVEEIFSFIFLENAVLKHHKGGKNYFRFCFSKPILFVMHLDIYIYV